MDGTDFISVLGALLGDGRLRDALSASPAEAAATLGLSEPVRRQVERLVPADLEFQARILLRKRYENVRRLLPRTCGRLGDAAWPEFVRFARNEPPAETDGAGADAEGFCRHLRRGRAECVSVIDGHRLHFARGGRRAALHLVRENSLRAPRLLLLLRTRGRRWEYLVGFGV